MAFTYEDFLRAKAIFTQGNCSNLECDECPLYDRCIENSDLDIPGSGTFEDDYTKEWMETESRRVIQEYEWDIVTEGFFTNE